MIKKEIEILEQLIAGIVWSIEVTDVDNTSGTDSVLTVCNTLYLNIGKTVTIDAVDYEVTAFTLNSSLTLKPKLASSPLVDTATTSFTINAPAFRHGSPKMVNTEHNKDKDDLTKYPLIWLLEFQEVDEYDDPEEELTSMMRGASLFFLDSCDKKNWEIDDHYREVIYPQENVKNLLVSAMKARLDLFGELLAVRRVIAWPNFGVFKTNEGNVQNILSDELSAIEMQIDIPFVGDLCDDCPPVEVCAPVELKVNGEGYGFSPAGSIKQLSIQNTEGDPVAVTKIDDNTGQVSVGSDPVPAAPTQKTGATTSFLTGDDADTLRGINTDFFTLSGLATDWPHGLLTRFVDTDKGQDYTNDLVVDVLGYDQIAGTVPVYYRIPQGPNRLDTLITTVQGLTIDGKTGWEVINEDELNRIENPGVTFGGGFALNYAPFNITARFIWTTTNINSVSSYRIMTNTSAIGTSGYTNSGIYAIAIRHYTITELGW